MYLTKQAPWLHNPFRLVSLEEIMELFEPVALLKSDDKDVLERWESLCIALGLISSAKALARLRAALDRDGGISFGEFRKYAEDVRTRIKDDLDGQLFLYVPPTESHFYEQPLRGWEQVVQRFPETIGDVEEASKCYALNRYAASVFHCMQVVEAALMELGKFIDIQPTHRLDWSTVTSRLELILRTQRPSSVQLSQFEQDNLDNLRQIYALASALQHAWRNKISHAGERLVLLSPDFTAEIAGEIMTASRSFARRIASDLPPKKSSV